MKGIQQEFIRVQISPRKFVVVVKTATYNVLGSVRVVNAAEGTVVCGPTSYVEATRLLIDKCRE